MRIKLVIGNKIQKLLIINQHNSMENMEQQINPDRKKADIICGKIDYILDHYLDQDGNLIKSVHTQGATLRDQLEKIKQDLEQIGQ